MAEALRRECGDEGNPDVSLGNQRGSLTAYRGKAVGTLAESGLGGLVLRCQIGWPAAGGTDLGKMTGPWEFPPAALCVLMVCEIVVGFTAEGGRVRVLRWIDGVS